MNKSKNKNIKWLLNYDVFGIISDFLSNDKGFFFFIEDNRCLLSKDRMANLYLLDWHSVSKDHRITSTIIDKYKDMLDWRILTQKHMNDIYFIRCYKDKMCWDIIISHILPLKSLISQASLFREFSGYIDWKRLSKEEGMCETFVDEFRDTIDWKTISRHQGLTEYLIRKYHRKIDWIALEMNENISLRIMNKYKNQNTSLLQYLNITGK